MPTMHYTKARTLPKLSWWARHVRPLIFKFKLNGRGA